MTREIGVVQALRRFQAAAIELSLFYLEDETASPIVASRFQVPGAFPALPLPITPPWLPTFPERLRFDPRYDDWISFSTKNEIDLRLAKTGSSPI